MAAQQPQNPALAGTEAGDSLLRTNPFTSDGDLRQGEALFQTHCSYCHGVHGEGGRGADLTAGVYRQGSSDSDLYKTIRTGVPGSEMPAVQISIEETWKIAGFVKRLGSQGLLEKAAGDRRAGQAVYEKIGCAACHRIGREGQDLGPDITDIGRRRGLSFLEESIVKPEAYIPNNYRAIQLVLKSGRTVVGIRLNEDDLSVQLRETAGDLRSFLKQDVKEIRHNQPSLMPSYESSLSKKELADLVAYLNSLKGAQ
jgi:putative heme-binding domain-containing protein